MPIGIVVLSGFGWRVVVHGVSLEEDSWDMNVFDMV